MTDESSNPNRAQRAQPAAPATPVPAALENETGSAYTKRVQKDAGVDPAAAENLPADAATTSAAAEPPSEKKGKLPDDFPGRAALEAAGINTYHQARAAGDLTEIEGIGAATAEKITAELA